jgi:uncharacterized protein (DUF885 family)
MLARRCLALAVGLLALAPSGCRKPDGGGPSPTTPNETATLEPSLARELERAAAGVDDEAFARLLREHWQDNLEHAPVFASSIGVHAFDDRWSERGPDARAAARARREGYLERARELAAGELSERDRLTLELFMAELESAGAMEACQLWAWSVSTRTNPLGELTEMATLARVDGDDHGAGLLQRYRSFAPIIDAQIADLRDGLARGLVGDAETLRRTIEMLDRQLASPVDEWSALDPVAKLPADDPLRVGAREAIATQIEPALQRYVSLLRAELLPAARDGAQIGVSALPDGATCYAALIRHHTSEQPSPEQLHELGLAHIARIDEEFRTLGKRVFGSPQPREREASPHGGRRPSTGDLHEREDELDEILARLRSDPALYFETAEQVEDFARASLRAAEAAAPKWFDQLPQTPCEVRPIPDYEAPYTTIGYYRQPSDVEPGIYFINTFAPTTRPRYEARVLAIHEAVPGHHTQIALAQELADAPAFRRHGGTTVFVEGWALYTERLADEMGLYETDLDRLGVLSFDAWRAARLVVDTGIHAKGWTRAQAIEFMLAHTALAENNIVNEVDRYVGWPGQALAYKYGQIELLRLREQARAELNDRFDIAEFHGVVLGAGAVTLPILRARVEAWVREIKANDG